MSMSPDEFEILHSIEIGPEGLGLTEFEACLYWPARCICDPDNGAWDDECPLHGLGVER
jgi:hypothetical protein